MLLVIAKASLPALEFAPRRSHSPPLFSSLGAALAWSATRYLLRSAHIKAHSAGDAAAVDRSWVSTMATMMAPTIGAKTYNRRATRFTSKVRFAPDSPLGGNRDSRLHPTRTQPTRQPEAVATGFEGQRNPRDLFTGPDRLIAPAMQQAKEPFGTRLQLLARLTLNAGKHTGNQPARLAQFDNGNDCAILVGCQRALG
jgi:hypothetical protein